MACYSLVFVIERSWKPYRTVIFLNIYGLMHSMKMTVGVWCVSLTHSIGNPSNDFALHYFNSPACGFSWKLPTNSCIVLMQDACDMASMCEKIHCTTTLGGLSVMCYIVPALYILSTIWCTWLTDYKRFCSRPCITCTLAKPHCCAYVPSFLVHFQHGWQRTNLTWNCVS